MLSTSCITFSNWLIKRFVRFYLFFAGFFTLRVILNWVKYNILFCLQQTGDSKTQVKLYDVAHMEARRACVGAFCRATMTQQEFFTLCQDCYFCGKKIPACWWARPVRSNNLTVIKILIKKWATGGEVSVITPTKIMDDCEGEDLAAVCLIIDLMWINMTTINQKKTSLNDKPSNLIITSMNTFIRHHNEAPWCLHVIFFSPLGWTWVLNVSCSTWAVSATSSLLKTLDVLDLCPRGR